MRWSVSALIKAAAAGSDLHDACAEPHHDSQFLARVDLDFLDRYGRKNEEVGVGDDVEDAAGDADFFRQVAPGS